MQKAILHLELDPTLSHQDPASPGAFSLSELELLSLVWSSKLVFL